MSLGKPAHSGSQAPAALGVLGTRCPWASNSAQPCPSGALQGPRPAAEMVSQTSSRCRVAPGVGAKLGCTCVTRRRGYPGVGCGCAWAGVRCRGSPFPPCVISEKDIKAEGWLVLFRHREKPGRFMLKLFPVQLLPLSFGFVAGR